MSEQRLSKYVTATLAAAAFVAFASGARAVEPNDNQAAFADSPTAVCHPAYRPCQKAPRPAADRSESASAAPIVEIEREPFGMVCHPAYQPCSSWAYRARASLTSAAAK